MSEKLSVAVVYNWLKEGKSRESIAEELGISMNEAKNTIFNHPKLKNVKVAKKPKYVLVDDLDSEVEEVEENTQTIVDKEPAIVEDFQTNFETQPETVVTEEVNVIEETANVDLSNVTTQTETLQEGIKPSQW